MLPTLAGRWQSRILLFVFIGLPITLIYALWLSEWRWPPVLVPFQVLCILFVIGLILDPLYIQIQRFRWDRDWPFAFQFLSMIFEFLIVLGIVWLDVLPFLPAVWVTDLAMLQTVVIHFLWVFLPSFIALLGFVQIFLIRWRFKGGEWGRM